MQQQRQNLNYDIPISRRHTHTDLATSRPPPRYDHDPYILFIQHTHTHIICGLSLPNLLSLPHHRSRLMASPQCLHLTPCSSPASVACTQSPIHVQALPPKSRQSNTSSTSHQKRALRFPGFPIWSRPIPGLTPFSSYDFLSYGSTIYT